MVSACALVFFGAPLPLETSDITPNMTVPSLISPGDLFMISEVGGVAVLPRCLGARCAYVADLIGKNVHEPVVKLCPC